MTRRALILAIDQGTTGSTVVVFDESFSVLSRGYAEVRTHYPQPGWVEQDATDLWDSVVRAISQALLQGELDAHDIAAIGVTNQRETSILWDRSTGLPVAEAIVWQCRRTEGICQELKSQGLADFYHRSTGLVLDPYFSGTKIHWMLDKHHLTPRAKNGELAFGTVDSYLLFRLTGGAVHATDSTNASRTLLMNLRFGQWDDALLEPLGIPRVLLPEIHRSCHRYGVTRGVPGLPDGIPITGVLGDQQAALFGQGAIAEGDMKCTYGTGSFLVMNVGKRVPLSSELLTTVAWNLDGELTYAIEGSAFVAGAAVQWLRDQLGLIRSAAEIETLASTVPDSGGVFFVPALTGLGAPHWKPEARGLFWGLTRGTQKGHLARAVLEGIALQNMDLLKLMESTAGVTVPHLCVDGGASRNNLLMQFQADIVERELHRPANIETTAAGAGMMAALGIGMLKGIEQIPGLIQLDRRFIPAMDHERVQYYTDQWRLMVARA
ncbi:glycerol kinase GlpK [Myxococcota bacterium]|nr:glycerol kinase GlpK [Myxococcota bacterium]